MSKSYRTRLSPNAARSLAAYGSSTTPTEPTVEQEDQVDTEATEVETVDTETTEVEQDLDTTESYDTDTTEEYVSDDSQYDEDTADEYDWINNLTIPEIEQSDSTTQETQTNHIEQKADEDDDEFITRLRKSLDDLETVDADVAEEIFDKLINPVVNHYNSRLQARVDVVDSGYNQLQQERKQQIQAETFRRIANKYPQVEKITNSTEFREWINADVSPYAREDNYALLARAYHSGDADYVIAQLDKFAESRKKPKPQVNADGRGGSKAVATKQRMTQEQFLAKRRAILSNPRAYPKGTLRKLEVEFFNQPQ